jgi:predicted RNase H-like HicB family nuclease
VILGGYTDEPRSRMALPVQDIDSIEVALHLSCCLRDDDDAWAASSPALDVVTQADSKRAAKAALEEAVEMWVESCLERETLGEALRELGWHRVDGSASAGSQAVMVPPETGAEALGEPFRLTLRMPAYRVDHLLGAEERAAG